MINFLMTLTIQTTRLSVKLRPTRAALVHGLIILPVDLSVRRVVRRPVKMTHVKHLKLHRLPVKMECVCVYKQTDIHRDHLTLCGTNIFYSFP